MTWERKAGTDLEGKPCHGCGRTVWKKPGAIAFRKCEACYTRMKTRVQLEPLSEMKSIVMEAGTVVVEEDGAGGWVFAPERGQIEDTTDEEREIRDTYYLPPAAREKAVWRVLPERYRHHLYAERGAGVAPQDIRIRHGADADSDASWVDRAKVI